MVIEKKKGKKTAQEKLADCLNKGPVERINSVLKVLKKNSLEHRDIKFCREIIRQAPMPDDSALVLRVDTGLGVKEVFIRPIELEVLSENEVKIGDDLYRLTDIKSIDLSSKALQYHAS